MCTGRAHAFTAPTQEHATQTAEIARTRPMRQITRRLYPAARYCPGDVGAERGDRAASHRGLRVPTDVWWASRAMWIRPRPSRPAGPALFLLVGVLGGRQLERAVEDFLEVALLDRERPVRELA